jgi:predicted MFS family arabinose efflux permease
MQPVLYYLTFVAVAAVMAVVLIGVLNMARMPKPDEDPRAPGSVTNLSQQLMRWRVILQFVAIVIIMAVVALSR